LNAAMKDRLAGAPRLAAALREPARSQTFTPGSSRNVATREPAFPAVRSNWHADSPRPQEARVGRTVTAGRTTAPTNPTSPTWSLARQRRRPRLAVSRNLPFDFERKSPPQQSALRIVHRPLSSWLTSKGRPPESFTTFFVSRQYDARRLGASCLEMASRPQAKARFRLRP
jgi:hypothetical protein